MSSIFAATACSNESASDSESITLTDTVTPILGIVAPADAESVTLTDTVKARLNVNPATNPACDVSGTSSGLSGLADVTDLQTIIDEALGIAPPKDYLAGNLFVGIVDIQIVMNAVLGNGCTGQ